MAGNNDSNVHYRKARMVMMKVAQIAPMGRRHRVSSENAWPLRNSDGLTFAEAKRRKEREKSK
jgi:hypothetical protein